MVVTLRCVPPRLTRSLTTRASKVGRSHRADTAHGVAYVAKRQTDRDSAAPYRSRATVPFVVPGTGRLADWRMVQRSMDGFHHAEEPLSPDSLDGNFVRPADADFSAGRKRNSKPLLTQPPPSISGRNSPVRWQEERDWSRGRPCPLVSATPWFLIQKVAADRQPVTRIPRSNHEKG